jgi:hypothetical protein
MPQEIVFTTLPNGQITKEGKKFLKVSVYATIRVKTPGDSSLGKFEDILNWPDRLAQAQFKFSFGGSSQADAIPDGTELDPDLYKSIFHKDIRLKGYLPEDLSKLKINSFSAGNIKEYLVKNYQLAAIESPSKLISAEKFIDENRFGVISRFKIDEAQVSRIHSVNRAAAVKPSALLVTRKSEHERILSDKTRLRFTPIPKKPDAPADFALFRNFHKADKWKRTQEPEKIKKPEFEFHEIVAITNSYPQLMRKLGFISDFLIPLDSSFPKNGGINLIPASLKFTEDDTVVSVPQTAYAITDSGFFTDDKPDSIFKRGFVKIHTDEFSVIQIDADGAAIKASNLTENKAQQIAHYFSSKSDFNHIIVNQDTPDIHPAEPPEDEGLPFIRSAGIAVTKNGMAEHLIGRIDANVKLHTSLLAQPAENRSMVPGLRLKLPDNKLYSSDIIQGYRMDIAYESEPEKWYSLHKRQDSYTWYDEDSKPHPIGDIDQDEGFIELGIAEDKDDPSDVFVSDTIARWEGWSLSVGKPGLAINHADDNPKPPEDGIKRDFVHKTKTLELKKYSFDPELHFRVNAQSKPVAGTLPKLRFGTEYRIRIRAVDLAGNSVPVEVSASDPAVTEYGNIRYLRYEPLASPIVLAGNELKDGESLERLVIRSNFDQGVSEYENSHKLKDLVFDDSSQRFLLPPRNSQAMAETHGMFENAFKGNPDTIREIYSIISSHEGSYDRDGATSEKIYKPDDVSIVYLPDPMAAGVAFFVSEGSETTHTQDFFKPRLFGFYTNNEIKPEDTNTDIPVDWYNARFMRIRLVENETGSDWDKDARILTVSLPKGIRTRIRFSSFWREKDIKQLSAIWLMIKEQSPSNIKELEELVRTGRHWMISPSREFELVHATQQPVEEPVLKALIPHRDFSDTTVDINTRFTVHGESTDKAELQCRWSEPLDDGISVSIKTTMGSNTIPDITIHYHDDLVTRGTIPELPKIELKQNPKLFFEPHHDLRPRTNAEFRVDPQPGALKTTKLFKIQAEGFEKLQTANTRASASVVDRLRYDIQASKFRFMKSVSLRILPLNQNFGDTKHRWVDYRLQVNSRYSEYFDKLHKQDTTLSFVRAGAWQEKVNILSTDRPKTPEIDYIIPTFEWRKEQTENTIRHRRMGGGLRIYMKRPWYSSGDDEMLGVILPPVVNDKKQQPVAVMATVGGRSYTPYYTHWGLDPLHISTPPSQISPSKDNFRLDPVFEDSVQYPDPKTLRACVAGYPVEFDEDRQLWYADIAVSPANMYFPFIRLALARYQKHSVRKGTDDVCLSNVVMADMIQLVPDRSTTLTFNHDDNNAKFVITVEGVIYDGSYRDSRLTDTVIKISFLKSRLAQPIGAMIDDASTPKNLAEEEIVIPVAPKHISNNRFTVSNEFRLPKEYKSAPFKIVIREYEQIPAKTKDVDNEYNDRVTRSPETDKLIYADIFEINGSGES